MFTVVPAVLFLQFVLNEDLFVFVISKRWHSINICQAKDDLKVEEEMLIDAKNGDTSLISQAMAEEELKLLEEREKEEVDDEVKEAPPLVDSQYTKLDELLTQTQLYSEFLLEKMDDITKVYSFYFMSILGNYNMLLLINYFN